MSLLIIVFYIHIELIIKLYVIATVIVVKAKKKTAIWNKHDETLRADLVDFELCIYLERAEVMRGQSSPFNTPGLCQHRMAIEASSNRKSLIPLSNRLLFRHIRGVYFTVIVAVNVKEEHD